MNLSKVIAKDKQRDGGFQVFPFTAESICQARQSANPHSYCEVHPFDVAGANQIHIRVTDPRLFGGAFELCGAVARFFLAGDVNLNQLTIINAGAKAQTNGVRISVHAIGCQLKFASRGLVQFLNKHFRVLARATAKVPSQNQFATPIQGQECPAIALAFVILFSLIPLLAIGVTPKLVGLSFLSLYFAYAVLQNGLALVASNLEYPQDRGDRHVPHTGCAANATAFRQTIKNTKQRFVRQVDRLNRFAGSLKERALTVAAFESRSLILSEVSVKVGITTAISARDLCKSPAIQKLLHLFEYSSPALNLAEYLASDYSHKQLGGC